MQREAADCEMFLCFGSVSACLQSSAMEILLGLNTLLHSVRPNQVVSGLLSSYTVAWKTTHFASLYSFCKKKGGRSKGWPFHCWTFLNATPWHSSARMYCTNAVELCICWGVNLSLLTLHQCSANVVSLSLSVLTCTTLQMSTLCETMTLKRLQKPLWPGLFTVNNKAHFMLFIRWKSRLLHSTKPQKRTFEVYHPMFIKNNIMWTWIKLWLMTEWIRGEN